MTRPVSPDTIRGARRWPPSYAARSLRSWGLVILLGVASHFAVPVDRLHRNSKFMPDMAFSPSFTAHESNPNFADGKRL